MTADIDDLHSAINDAVEEWLERDGTSVPEVLAVLGSTTGEILGRIYNGYDTATLAAACTAVGDTINIFVREVTAGKAGVAPLTPITDDPRPAS